MAKKHSFRQTTEKHHLIRLGKCWKCGKFSVFFRSRAALCRKCALKCSSLEVDPLPRNTYRYKRARRKLIREVGMCQLCGKTTKLTAHHIGGKPNLGLTCLCVGCHQAYEHWMQVNKKKG